MFWHFDHKVGVKNVFSASLVEELAFKEEEPLIQEPMLRELHHILDSKLIRTVFQPIVSLSDAAVIGYEALSRGPEGSALEFPDALFKEAHNHKLIWELEYLCRIRALERTRDLAADKMIFINIDPQSMDDPRFQKGVTKEMLDYYGLDASNVIFEITEKTAIDDYVKFRKVLDNYTSQGYKIAIDDTGSGYSGLQLLAQTYPHFIKVDMELVRNIDKDGLKQAMMRALYDFAAITNSKIIAEGIETEDEMAALIEIGVPYGQGFFLKRPAATFLDIPVPVRQFILKKNEQKKREVYSTPLTIPVGEVSCKDKCFSPDTLGYQAIDYFTNNTNHQGVAVVGNGRPLGLLMKTKLMASLATQYGVAVYMNRPISLLMERKPLIVDYHTPLEQVSKAALARSEDDIYDYIIVSRNGEYFGTVTVKRLLEKTSQLELNRAKHSNPLTGLPGNVIIEEKLKQLLNTAGEFSVIYFDLDNFKAFNDVYGFESGDNVLCVTANLIQKIFHEQNIPGVFIGHIGGDDFIAIIGGVDASSLCNQLIGEFDQKIRDYYTEEDRQQGYIVTPNRHGLLEKYPLISLSIAVVTNATRQFRNSEEIAEAAAALKKRCKMIWHSCFEIA
jgi:diguanylate cyclase (GGDEF)-like protein